MDEDDNISNADISMDDDDEDDPQQQQHQEQQQQPNNAAATNTHQQQLQRLALLRDQDDDDESSDVHLPTYALQFQLANVAGRNEPNSAADVSGSGSAAVNDSPRRRHNAATTAASTAGAGSAPTVAGGTGTGTGTATSGATTGGASSSAFNDWDSDTATAGSSSGSVGGQEEPNDATSTGAASNNSGAKPSFFFGTSSFILRSRKEVAALINTECCRGGPTPDLDSIMETLFNSGTPIDNPDNIEWIRWLIAGGRTPKEFVKIGKFKNKSQDQIPWNSSNRQSGEGRGRESI